MKLGQDQFHASTRDSWIQSDLDEPVHHPTPGGQDRWTAEIWDLCTEDTGPDGWDSHWEHRVSGPGRWDCAGRHVLHDEGENLFGSLRWRSRLQVWGQVLW